MAVWSLQTFSCVLPVLARMTSQTAPTIDMNATLRIMNGVLMASVVLTARKYTQTAVQPRRLSTVLQDTADSLVSSAQVSSKDFRCSLKKPFLCSNLECAADINSCPLNHLSHMIKEVDHQIRISENDSQAEVVRTSSDVDSNINLVAVKFDRSSLFYSPYTAGYAYLSLQSQDKISLSVKLEAVPFSFVNPSAFEYDELDLESEKLASLIFMKSVSDLQPVEFIRSPIFRLYLDGYEYNHFIVGPFQVTVNFNKIKGFPDFAANEKEIEAIQEQADIKMNITDPSNYYCLANFNELTKTWACVSRNVLSISENKIEFSVVTTGVFAVIFCPKVEESVIQFCGFVCQNKRGLTILFTILLPILLIVAGFIWAVVKMSYQKLEEKIKFVTSGEDEAVFKETKEETGDEGATVETAKHAYNNPLVFKDDPQLNDMQSMENAKMKLKHKDEKLLAEKLKQLRKNMSLRFEMESIQEGISRLKEMQGAAAFERDDNKS